MDSQNSPVHVTKACRGKWDTTPHLLNLGVRWRWVVKLRPLPLFPRGKSPCADLTGGLVGHRARFGSCRKSKISCLAIALFKHRIIRISRWLDTGLKVFCCTWKTSSLLKIMISLYVYHWKWKGNFFCSTFYTFPIDLDWAQSSLPFPRSVTCCM